MSDKTLGDGLVISLHLDIAIQCLENALKALEQNKYGEAKHELSKALLDAEEARKLYHKIGGKN